MLKKLLVLPIMLIGIVAMNTVDLGAQEAEYIYGATSEGLTKLDSNGNEIWTFTGHTYKVNGVEVDTDGNTFTASHDGTVKK